MSKNSHTNVGQLFEDVKTAMERVDKKREALTADLNKKTAILERFQNSDIVDMDLMLTAGSTLEIAAEIERIKKAINAPYLSDKEYRKAVKKWLVEWGKERQSVSDANAAEIERQYNIITEAKNEIERLKNKTHDINCETSDQAENAGLGFDLSIRFVDHNPKYVINSAILTELEKYE